MKTASPNSGSDIHTLTPIAMSAARTQTDFTSSLRAASCAVPYAWVASNALMYVRPCLRRIPKAFPARTNTMSSESGAKSTGIARA